MKFGEIFGPLMARAIEREERELERLKTEARNSRITADTVRIYGEHWFWPAFLKEALGDPSCPNLAWEGHFIDCCFLGSNEEHLARFEFKPFFPVPKLNPAAFSKIQKDFSNQLDRSKASRAVEHYVVLVPYGNTSDISTWVSETLLSTIKPDYLDARLEELPNPSPIRLNRSDDGYATVKVFQVTSA